MEQNHFDIAIVDEAGQATEPAIYPTLVRCPSRLILAGDPHQLPPTVISENKTLSFTLLEKLMKYYPENVVMLKEFMHIISCIECITFMVSYFILYDRLPVYMTLIFQYAYT